MQELELFQALARHVGAGMVEAMAGTAEDWKRRLLAPVAAAGITLDAIRQGPLRNPRNGTLRFPNRRVETPSGLSRDSRYGVRIVDVVLKDAAGQASPTTQTPGLGQRL